MTKEYLMKFCLNDPCSAHQELSQLWSRGDYTFATDGRIMVRIPRLPDIPEYAGTIDVGAIWPKEIMAGPACDMPVFPEPKFVDCPRCHGKGTKKDFKFDDNLTPQPCDECDGDGKFEVCERVAIGDQFFSNHLLALIKDFPNIKIYPNQELKPAYFSFAGGDGLIMPMRGD